MSEPEADPLDIPALEVSALTERIRAVTDTEPRAAIVLSALTYELTAALGALGLPPKLAEAALDVLMVTMKEQLRAFPHIHP